MRARGLKLAERDTILRFIIVAPHAGAWIETTEPLPHIVPTLVAPHAGAWIETYLGVLLIFEIIPVHIFTTDTKCPITCFMIVLHAKTKSFYAENFTGCWRREAGH